MIPIDDTTDLGSCCACGQACRPRNLVMLAHRTREPGTGWGCFMCGLPSDGALAAVCDRCIADGTPIQSAIDGPATSGARVPLALLPGPFEHNPEQHIAEFVAGHLPGDPIAVAIANLLRRNHPKLYHTLDELVYRGQTKQKILAHTSGAEPGSPLDSMIHIAIDVLLHQYHAALYKMELADGPTARTWTADPDTGREAALQCYRCGRISYNPNDMLHKYCSSCTYYHIQITSCCIVA